MFSFLRWIMDGAMIVPVLVSVPFSGMCLLGGCLIEEAAFWEPLAVIFSFSPFSDTPSLRGLLLLGYDHIDGRRSTFNSLFASSSREGGIADGVDEAKLTEMYTLQTTVA